MTKYKLGTLVTLAGGISPFNTQVLLGIIVKKGTRQSSMYGGGVLEEDYVEVKWFSPKYVKLASYTHPRTSLQIVSEIDLTNEMESDSVIRW